MKKRNRSIVLACLISAALLTGTLAGCGKSENSADSSTQGAGQSTPTAESSTGAKKNVTLTVAASQDWIVDIDKTLAARFTDETGIKIDQQLNPNDQYTSIVKAKLASGEGPDIFYCNGAIGMNEYLPDKYFTDLSNEGWVQGMVEWAKQATTYKGKTVGLDMWSVDGWGMLYNDKIFDKYNLKVPTTFDEFLKVCDTLKANGITPIYEPGKDSWHQCIWLLSLGDYVNKKYPGLYDKLNTAEGKFADIPEALTLTEQLKQVVDKGYFGKNFMSQTWDGRMDAMISGKYAMLLTYTAQTAEIMEKYTDSGADSWKMFPVPMAGNNSFSTSGGGEVMVINKNSKYIDEAKQYFNFLTKPENLQTYYDNKKKLVTAAFSSVKMKESVAWKSMLENSKGGMGIDFSAGTPYYNADNIGKVYQDLYLGTKTPKQVLDKIDADRAKMFSATTGK